MRNETRPSLDCQDVVFQCLTDGCDKQLERVLRNILWIMVLEKAGRNES